MEKDWRKRFRTLEEQKKRLDTLVDCVQGGIIALDRDYTIKSVNKYIEDWLSTPAADLIGRNAIDIFHEKIGICPHCAARSTFETGEINSIMQSKGINYAELTAYPIRNESGEILEAVVFIMDITERVLYQEETLGLYREVIQTKEYLESIINNSADAIVTSDRDGLVTSWNQGAEKIFGFAENEVVGTFLPFVPDFLLEKELENIERIKQGEVLKDIEALRKKKDGSIIEISLTLSPIKDATGDIIGISGISRDISDKKRVEKELIRRNQEISRLFFISSAMRSTLELDRLLRMVLTAITMSDGMGFNRAILFLVDESRNVLKGVMGMGPASPEESWKVWDDLSLKHKTLNDVMQEIATAPLKKESYLEKLTVGIEISLEEEGALSRAVKEKKPLNILNAKEEPLSDAVLVRQLSTEAYAVVPLISRNNVIGLIWVDNYFNRKPILEEDMQFLASFSNHVASAIESARLFEQVTMAEQQLENIFESMSDMVYFNSSDYIIKRVNKAVLDKVGLSHSEVVGKKCYEIFHGLDQPPEKCPHHKTVKTKKAYIEEIEEPHLGGSFLTSSSPILDHSGEFIGSVHVVRDITEIKKIRENLSKTERELDFRAAHKLGNPIYALETELLTMRKRIEKGNFNILEIIEAMNVSIEKSKKIISELKSLTRAATINVQEIDIMPIIRHSLRIAQQHGVDVEIESSEEMPPILSDPLKMTECFDELIANALKWFNKREKRVTVRIDIPDEKQISDRLKKDHKFIRLLISDNGPGIPADKKDSIFNPFYTTDRDGSGLGLAVVQRNIEASNGLIQEIGNYGEGAVFEIYLPCANIEEGTYRYG